MKTALTVAMFALIAIAIWVPFVRYAIKGGFRKPPTVPNHARLVARPGATLDLVDDNGLVVARVIMHNITRDHNGTSVEFVDYFRFMERYRVS